MYEIRYERQARRQLRSLPLEIARRIAIAIDRLREDPRPRGCRKLVHADDVYRVRIGNYRVIYNVRDDVLVVLIIRVAKRGEVYGDV